MQRAFEHLAELLAELPPDILATGVPWNFHGGSRSSDYRMMEIERGIKVLSIIERERESSVRVVSSGDSLVEKSLFEIPTGLLE